MVDMDEVTAEQVEKFDNLMEDLGAIEAAPFRKMVNEMIHQVSGNDNAMKALLLTMLTETPVYLGQRPTTFWKLREETFFENSGLSRNIGVRMGNRPNDYINTGYGYPVKTRLPSKAQLIALRDYQLEHGNASIAAAVDNVLDLISIRVAELRSLDDEPMSETNELRTELLG